MAKILFAVSEIAPWVKTGGLGDVCAALPEALHRAGCDVRVLVPAYPALLAAFPKAPMVAAIPAMDGLRYGAAVRLAHTADGMPLYLLECHAYFNRQGHPYLGPEGNDWLDNAWRFGLLSRVAALLASNQTPLDWSPDILHCHDWQTALAPAYLRYRYPQSQVRSVMTVHNLAFQGLFGRDLLAPLGLPDHAWTIDGIEYHGYLSFLKAGLEHADTITTVSPSYAREIQTAEGGAGLDGLLRHRQHVLHGIINGIDTDQWNPATDEYLTGDYVHYDLKHLAKKAKNTAALRHEMGLEARPDLPLIGIVSRFTQQKGLDLVPPLAEALAALPVQLAVLGSGDRGLEAAFRSLAANWPGQFAVRIGFDEALSHRIEAGADLFLMPSRFEPCGLNQMYSLHYATLPIVRATGGLNDTVVDASDAERGDGFVFTESSSTAVLTAIERAVATWHDKPRFKALQRRAVSADFSWQQPAAAYLDLYQKLISTAP